MACRPDPILRMGAGMGKRVYRDINVRGTVYADARAAAVALGVSPDAVRIAIRKGTTHRIGTGAVGIEPMPVRVRGRVFATAQAAAEHFGGTASGVYKAINSGRADSYLKPRRYNGATSKPVQIGTLTFSSMEEANRALGFGKGHISQVLRRGSKLARQRVLGAAMREAHRRARTEKGAD